jgi:hypothetical protein
MRLIVPTASVIRRATDWVGCIDLKAMFFDLIAMHVVQVTIVKVVGVSVVGDSDVATTRLVLMTVPLVLRLSAHFNLLRVRSHIFLPKAEHGKA